MLPSVQTAASGGLSPSRRQTGGSLGSVIRVDKAGESKNVVGGLHVLPLEQRVLLDEESFVGQADFNAAIMAKMASLAM